MISFLIFILTIGIVVGIHEFGHFQMARWCDVKVLKFSIGFGRPLFTFFLGKDQTAFILSAIPLGGYVKLLDENEKLVEEQIKKTDLSRAFNRQPLFKRFLIILAGPLINILLAIFLFCFLYIYGSTQIKPLISDVPMMSEAYEKGLRAGDEIMAIDGERIKSLEDLVTYLNTHQQQEFQHLKFRREGQVLGIKNILWDEEVKTFPYGVPILIQAIEPGSIAEKLGLKINDQILMIDQIPVKNISDLVSSIQNHWLKSYELIIKRESISYYIHVDKSFFEGKVEKKIMGVSLAYDKSAIKANSVEVNRTFIESIKKSLVQTFHFFHLTINTFKNLFTPQGNFKDLGGPLAIANMATSSFLAGGFFYLQFIGLISLNIGILNLLPIPLLDGGHLAFYLFEFFSGKPLSNQKMVISQRFGILFLSLLTFIALYNDAYRYLLGS